MLSRSLTITLDLNSTERIPQVTLLLKSIEANDLLLKHCKMNLS